MRLLEYEDSLISDIDEWPMWDIMKADDEDDEDEIIPLYDGVPESEDFAYIVKCMQLGQATGANPLHLYRHERRSDVYSWDALRIWNDYRMRPKR